jgi:hypothetical protein
VGGCGDHSQFCFMHFAKAALKSALKLEEVEAVIDIEDMG